ncbi:MAG TPA: hypothetical protein VFU35_16015 [Jatrophihabitans sp.]|nr:hypothetical protein [Jatrophihabitans sp.]
MQPLPGGTLGVPAATRVRAAGAEKTTTNKTTSPTSVVAEARA